MNKNAGGASTTLKTVLSALGGIGYMSWLSRDKIDAALTRTLAPAVHGTTDLGDIMYDAGQGYNKMLGAYKESIKKSDFKGDVHKAADSLYGDLRALRDNAARLSIGATLGGAAGYGLSALTGANEEYRTPMSLIGAALGGAGALMYPVNIKRANLQQTGDGIMFDQDKQNRIRGLYKTAGKWSTLWKIIWPARYAHRNKRALITGAAASIPTAALGGAGAWWLSAEDRERADAAKLKIREADREIKILNRKIRENNKDRAKRQAEQEAVDAARKAQELETSTKMSITVPKELLSIGAGTGLGAVTGYGVGSMFTKDKNYRLLAALAGGALGGISGYKYRDLIVPPGKIPAQNKTTSAYTTYEHNTEKGSTMSNNKSAAAGLTKDAGIKDWAKGALSLLKRIRTLKTTAVGRFTGNIKPWTPKATSKLPPGTGLAVGGAVTAGAIGRNMINNYYDAQAEAELQRQRDMDVHRAVLTSAQAQNAAQQALAKSNNQAESPAAPPQPNWAGLGIGAGAGGLAGYGVGAALSKDKLVRLLTALGGGALGGYVGNQLANQTVKQASLAMPTAERIMCKIASRDGSGLCTLTSLAAMRKTAAGEQAPTVWDKIQEWATADNYKNLKRVGTGLGVGLGTYALSGLLPGVRKERGARALLAGAAGLGAGLYGDKLVNGIQSYFNRSTAPARKQKQEQTTTTKATTQQAAQPANPQQVRIPTYQDFIQRMINPLGLPQPTLDKPFKPQPQPQYGPLRQPQVNLPTYKDFIRRMVAGPQLLPVQNAGLQQPSYGPRVR